MYPLPQISKMFLNLKKNVFRRIAFIEYVENVPRVGITSRSQSSYDQSYITSYSFLKKKIRNCFWQKRFKSENKCNNWSYEVRILMYGKYMGMFLLKTQLIK